MMGSVCRRRSLSKARLLFFPLQTPRCPSTPSTAMRRPLRRRLVDVLLPLEREEGSESERKGVNRRAFFRSMVFFLLLLFSMLFFFFFFFFLALPPPPSPPPHLQPLPR